MKALIVGAGIAGPAAALFLQRAGIQVELHELRNAGSQDATGQFLGLAPNGIDVLEALRLGDALRAASLPTPTMRLHNGNGRLLGTIAFGTGQRHGVTIKRAALHRILRDETERQGIPTHYGRKLIRIEHGGNKVYARFADDSLAEADLLVGADGIHSRVRRLLFPDAPSATPTGLVGYGGTAHCTGLEPTPHGMEMVYGRRAFFGYIVSPAREVLWWSTLDAAALQPGVPPDADAWRRLLLDLHAEDGPQIAKILRATWQDTMQIDIQDIRSLPHWSRGNAVLIGDAAHATSPHGGQGASISLEDGAWLAANLLGTGHGMSIEAALRDFQRQRQPRVERIVAASRRNGTPKAPKSELARWMRDRIMPLALRAFASPRRLVWQYEHTLPDLG